jgi:hypothetical protein
LTCLSSPAAIRAVVAEMAGPAGPDGPAGSDERRT